MTDVTPVLSAIERGDPQASEQLLPLVYAEFRRLAAAAPTKSPVKPWTPRASCMRRTCACRRRRSPTVGRPRHFFAAAAEAMRRILVDGRDSGNPETRRSSAPWRPGPAWRDGLQNASEQFLASMRPSTCSDIPLKAPSLSNAVFAGLPLRQTGGGVRHLLTTAERHWAYPLAPGFLESSAREYHEQSRRASGVIGE